MKKIFLIASMALCGFANAQITLTQNDVAAAGTYSVAAHDTATLVSEGLSGANRTWDFTSLKNQSGDTNRFISPAGAPDAASFPASNLVLKQFDASEKAFLYIFLKVSSTSLEVLGFSGRSQGLPAHPAYNPPVKLLTFPFTYNSSISGKSQLTVGLGFPSAETDSIKLVSTVTYSTLADSWGSVLTPSGTSNSLRLKKIFTTVDSTFYHYTSTNKWVWNNSAPSTKTDTSYQWWSNGKSNNVAEITLNGKSSRQGNYLLTVKTLTGLSEKIAGAEVSIFPNPASGILNIRIDGAGNNTTIEFANVLGERVLSSALNGEASKIDISKLPKGLYSYQIKNDSAVLKVGKVFFE